MGSTQCCSGGCEGLASPYMIEMDTNIPSRRSTNKYIQSTDGNHSFYTGRAETLDGNNMDTKISVTDWTNKSVYNSVGAN